MGAAEHLGAGRRHPLPQRHGLRVAAEQAVGGGEAVARGEGVRVARAEDALAGLVDVEQQRVALVEALRAEVGDREVALHGQGGPVSHAEHGATADQELFELRDGQLRVPLPEVRDGLVVADRQARRGPLVDAAAQPTRSSRHRRPHLRGGTSGSNSPTLPIRGAGHDRHRRADLLRNGGAHVEDPADPAQPQHDDPVGHGDDVLQVVRDHHDADPPRPQLPDHVQDHGPLLDAERGGRLVQHHEARVAEQRTRDGHDLPLGAGEVGDLGVHAEPARVKLAQQLRRVLGHGGVVEERSRRARGRGTCSRRSSCWCTGRGPGTRWRCQGRAPCPGGRSAPARR